MDDDTSAGTPDLPPPPPPIGASDWAVSSPTPVTTAELRPQRGLTRAVTVLVAIVALVNLLSIPNDLAYLGSLQDAADGDFSVIGDIEDQEDLRDTFGMLALATTLVAGVVWVVWQQRARGNATAMGAGGQRHTSGLAAGGWFLPIANLVIPKQVTNDLWRATDPDAPGAFRIEGRPVWPLLDLWWALWVIGGIISRFIFSSEPDDLDGLISSVKMELAAQLLVVVAAGLAVLVVLRITDRLGQRAANAGLHLL